MVAGAVGWVVLVGGLTATAGGGWMFGAATLADGVFGVPGRTTLWPMLLAWAGFAVVGVAATRTPARLAVPLALAGCVVAQVVALSAPPTSSDDVHRYVWDGRVQSAGVDPYAYAPEDPALAALRDDWLFPGPAGCAELGRDPGCTTINRPSVRTVYPPGAQLWFRTVDAVAPPDAQALPFQVGGALIVLAVAVLLLGVLRRAGRDPRWVIAWVACPAVTWEITHEAHVDGLAALAVVGGLALLSRRRPGWAGALLAAAALIKLWPAVLAVVALRRGPVRLVTVAVAVAALAYLPHVLALGPDVLGFLPGYLAEEGYDDGGRFALVGPVAAPLVPLLGPSVPTVLAGAVLATVLAVAAWRADPDDPWPAAALAAGGVLLVTTPTYPWYAVTLVALAAAAARPAWLLVPLAGVFAYLGFGLRPAGIGGRLGYLLALLAVSGTSLVARATRKVPE